MQVDPTVGVGLGVTDVVDVTFAVLVTIVVDTTVVGLAVVELAVEVVLTLEVVAAGSRQMLNRQEAPHILFASPAHAMEQSVSAVLALAAGAALEHQHSRA